MEVDKDHIGLLNFVWEKLFDIYPHSMSVGRLFYKYKKEIDKEFESENKDRKYFTDRYDGIYFEFVHGTIDQIKLYADVVQIIKEHKTFSMYLNYENQKASEFENNEAIGRKYTELQIEALEYQKTIRELNEQKSNLEIENGKFQKIKNYVWIIRIGFFILGMAISWIVQYLL